MKILIVGGGVAGSAFAGFAKKYNLGEVVLVEKAPAFGTIGFLLGIWGNGRKVLKELGIDTYVVEKNGYEIAWNAFEDMHAHLLKAFPINIFRKYGPTSVVSRSALHEGLVKTLQGADVRFGTVVLNLEQLDSKQVRVNFSDGRKEIFDLVVGADGIKSSIRDQVFGKGFLNYYNWGVWVYWLPDGFKHPQHVTARSDMGKMYSIFPLYERSAVWFVAKVPKGSGLVVSQRGTKLKQLFSSFDGYVQEVLKLMPPPEKLFFDDLAYVDMPHWYRGRVVMMGDAVHASSPITGMGASMALEDAFVLADELRKSGEGGIDDALQRFERRRQKRVKKYKKITRLFDKWCMTGGILGAVRDLLLPYVPISFFLNSIKKLLEDDI